MANKTFKDATFRLANTTAGSTGRINLTAYVNQHSLKSVIALIEDSAYTDSNRRYIPGLAGKTVSLNGFLNTTVDGVLGYFMANQTSVSRSFEMKAYTGRYYNGSVFPTDVQYSGSVNNMQTWSVNLTFDGAVNRTSVALA